MRRTTRALRWMVLGLALTGGAARAADLVVYYPDGPQDPSAMVAAFAPIRQQARDAQHLDLNGHYFAQLVDFQKFIDSGKPEFGIVDAVFYLENADKLGMQVIAVPQDASGQSLQSYCLIVPASKPYAKIDDLSAKTLAQTPLNAKFPYFVTDFLLEGSYPATFFKPKPVSSGQSAVKAVELEESDAAFVPCSLGNASKKVKSIFTTRPVPLPVVVSFSSAPAGDADKFKTVILGLDASAQLCKTLQVSKFTAAPADYAKLLAAYRNNPVPNLDELRVGKVEGQSTEITPAGIVALNFLETLRTRLMPADQSQ